MECYDFDWQINKYMIHCRGMQQSCRQAGKENMYIHKLGTDEAYRISLKVFKQPDASKENMFRKSQMPEFISLKHVS